MTKWLTSKFFKYIIEVMYNLKTNYGNVIILDSNPFRSYSHDPIRIWIYLEAKIELCFWWKLETLYRIITYQLASVIICIIWMSPISLRVEWVELYNGLTPLKMNDLAPIFYSTVSWTTCYCLYEIEFLFWIPAGIRE